MRALRREDYHAEDSSYSIGFLEREGHVLLLHQTAWSRLDITDLDTGRLLTNREVWIREVRPGYTDENGKWVPRKCAYSNHIDYFHSRLHISPGSRRFLSNGWAWAPVDYIRCFSVEDFLRDYEPSGFGVTYYSGYNWDRPCAFLDDDRFVIAVDDHSPELSGEELEAYTYRQLQFYRFSDHRGEKLLEPCREVACEAFPHKGADWEVTGELHYDAATNSLIALTGSGACLLSLEGEVLARSKAICHTGDRSSPNTPRWAWSPAHRLFYRWCEADAAFEIRALEALRS